MGSESIWAGCAALVFCCAGGVAAAEPAPAERTGDSPVVTELQEVVVTATRRPTLLEETPISITAFSGSALDRQHVDDLSNIAVVTPGLVFTSLSRQESYPSIRGTSVGNDAPGSDLGVSVFIDDIPTTGVGDNDPNLFDLQSVEVLRGPQGTLFGRNATGGALVIHTLPPDFTPHEKAELSYGNYNLVEGRGYVTGPISGSTLAGKFTFDVRRQDGIMDNELLDTTTVSTRLWGTRGQLLWTPAEGVRVLIGMDYSRDTSPYKAQQLIGNFQPSLFPPLSYGASDTEQAIGSTGDAKTGGGFIRADYTLPVCKLSSITGYRHADSRDYFSTTADPFNTILQHYRVGADQITEEIHLSSRQEQPLDWVAGLFFLNSQREGLKHYDLNVQPGAVVGIVQDPYTALQFSSNDLQHVHAHSYAAFGEAGYAFASVWKLTLGARFTKEDKAGHSEKNDTSGLSPDLAATYSHSWNAFNPKATLQYQPSRRLLAYATVASGFKSGGYDTSATTNEGLATPFRPEKVLSYEIGLKAASEDDGFVVNAAAYYAKYTDLQVQEFQNLQYVTANAGTANIPGVELEALFNPWSWLTLTGNYSYMNARYSSYVQGDGAVFTGNQIPFDVKYHYTLGAELHFQAPRSVPGGVKIGADLTYQGKKYFENENNDYAFITDRTRIRGLLNLHASWTSSDETWEVSLWGNNVTDDRYIVNATDLTAFYAIPEFTATDASGAAINKLYVGNWNSPKMFGVSFTFRH
jgi:iron complex outermembrane recepter protein